MPRLSIILLVLVFLGCNNVQLCILDTHYFVDVKYDLTLEPGEEIDLCGFYQIDSDSVGRIYIYELKDKGLDLSAKIPVRQKFSELNNRWLKIYGFYGGNSIDVKEWDEIKPSQIELTNVANVASKKANTFYESSRMIKDLLQNYPLDTNTFRDTKPILTYIDRSGQNLIYHIKGPIFPPESVASVVHEYVSVYLIYNKKTSRVNKIAILKEGWMEE